MDREASRTENLCFPEMIMLIDQLAEMTSPAEAVRFEDFNVTSEVIDLIQYARVRRLRPRIRVAANDLSIESLERLASETEPVIVIPIEGSVGADRADAMIRLAEHAALLDLSVEIETLLRPSGLFGLSLLARFVRASGFDTWSIDFLGDPKLKAGLLTSRENARAFSLLVEFASGIGARVEIREAPSFRRFLDERHPRRWNGESEMRQESNFAIINSGESLLISPVGDVAPGRTVPMRIGSVRRSELASIRARSPLWNALRDPGQLRGRCGVCAWNDVCGGSRARAWRVKRDLLAEDPGCFRAPAGKVRPVAQHSRPDRQRI